MDSAAEREQAFPWLNRFNRPCGSYDDHRMIDLSHQLGRGKTFKETNRNINQFERAMRQIDRQTIERDLRPTTYDLAIVSHHKGLDMMLSVQPG